MNGLKVVNVSKRFGDVQALKNVSIDFNENKIYGLLGRNGAGKSTLLNIITGKIFADEGSVSLDGECIPENDRVLSKLFMMGERNYYPAGMTVVDAFCWTKEFYPGFDAERAFRLSKDFGLNIKSKIKSLSTGYSSIFRLITALCVNVPYVLLDEPVLGLDANHRDLFYRILIEQYAENPATFIISTHLIEEVSGIIEEVVIIREGEIIRNESRESLLSKYYCVSGRISDVDGYIAGKRVLASETLGGLKTAYVEGVPDINSPNLEISKMDLQKLFIQLTNSQGGITE